MRRTYLGAVCGGAGNYGIVFLDVQGCTSASDTLEGVLESGAEALSGHLDLLVEDGGSLPVATVHDMSAVIKWLADDNGPIEETWVGLYPVTVLIPAADDTVAVRIKSELVQRIADSAHDTAVDLHGSRAFIERAVETALADMKRAA